MADSQRRARLPKPRSAARRSGAVPAVPGGSETTAATSRGPSPRILYAIFALSGAAGLIYESIWTRYLQLFLGHAAYAQVLVIALFMGGMGAGALAASRLPRLRTQPLVLYALVEAVLGIAGFAFHPLYQAATTAAYDAWLPAAATATTSRLIEWSVAAALVVPQSVLLGMTFPLMSAAVLRTGRAASGRAFALLYFTNSLGAVAGVLLSGFWLIATLGLPGTTMTAGATNLVVAAVAMLAALAARRGAPGLPPVTRIPAGRAIGTGLLAIAFLTAVSSFFYEIAWLRMMALVEGASTHAFETMLSAFILGIALGGWAIRTRIDTFANPVRALAIVQVAMGIAAIATLFVYPLTFEGMRIALARLPHNGAGYAGFSVVGWLLAAVVMIPASFCAGMTLPLVTAVLYARGRGEGDIGRVYGWNTLGSIAGVVLGGLWLMPMLGLRNLVVAGAAIDIAIGIGLFVWLYRTAASAKRTAMRIDPLPGVLAGTALLLIVVALVQPFDRAQLISGVFRTGRSQLPPSTTVVDYADGRTATVSVMHLPNGNVAIATNAKVDAAINMDPGRRYALGPDEFTMTLLGILPLAYRPEARNVAVIGHGSGLTAHVMLGSPNVQRVDTIEIEPQMVRAARRFLPRVERVYNDPRSRIHIEDARAFFARPVEPYDIIVSEPSNPWVSGVASLFTVEFYRHASRALKPDGLFVQWFHLYETDRALVRSIAGAMAGSFGDYAIYATNESDAVIVATRSGALPRLDDAWFGWPALAGDLRRIDISAPEQLRYFRVASRRGYAPLLEQGAVNSDYRPVLEFGAARARFIRSSDSILLAAARDAVPVLEILSGFDPPARAPPSPLIASALPRFRDAMRGNAIADALVADRTPVPDDGLSDAEMQALRRVRDFAANVDPAAWQEWFLALAVLSKPMLVNGNTGAFDRFVNSAAVRAAMSKAPAIVGDKIAMLGAVGARDLARIQHDGARLLATSLQQEDPGFHAYVLIATIAACLAAPGPAADPQCPEAVALLDRVQAESFVIDLERAHRDRAASASIR